MNDTQLPPTDALTEQSSPGEMLRHGRQALEISQQEVAVALNLRPAVIQGLENDSYDEVPVTIYRRGYLRSYANLLGMDPEVVLAAYQARNADADRASETQARPLQLQKRPSSIGTWLFRLMTLVVIVGLAGLTLMWWQSRGGNQPPAPGTSEPVAVDSRDGTITIDEPARTQQAPPESSITNDTHPVIETAQPEPATPVADAQPSAAADPASEAGSQTAVANASGTADDSAAAGEQESAALVSQEADQAAPPTTDASEEAPANPNLLKLVFNKESWVQINDANGKTVFVGLQQAGTDASIEGTPPLRLTIGNANGVEMTWRGDTENVGSRAAAGNVARFTLGE
ncbi:MAG: RodZ domain-containing protein [Halomonas sp.]|uniref:RodZ domain-containing protein n=1 Tax=Halomonas sp. TaxID=1486246 RepID=UPI003F8F6DA6